MTEKKRPEKKNSHLLEDVGAGGLYKAEIARTQPSAFLILLDESESMNDEAASGQPKRKIVSDIVNNTIRQHIVRNTKEKKIFDRYDIGILGYGDDAVRNIFRGLGDNVFQPLSLIQQFPLRVEDRKQEIYDAATGDNVTKEIKFPVWFEAHAKGDTPMCLGLREARKTLGSWCASHPRSYPPTLLHVTDAELNDGTFDEVEALADEIRRIGTDDGATLIFNIHISSSKAYPVEFPTSDEGLPDEFAKLLYRMSSLLPQSLIEYAQGHGYEEKVRQNSRGFVFNAEESQIVHLFDVGTRAAERLR
jgi:hypothetical protein